MRPRHKDVPEGLNEDAPDVLVCPFVCISRVRLLGQAKDTNARIPVCAFRQILVLDVDLDVSEAPGRIFEAATPRLARKDIYSPPRFAHRARNR